MKNSKNQKINYRKLTRSRSWIGIVIFFFIIILIHVITLVAVTAFMAYTIENKMMSEIKDSAHMAEMYDKGAPASDSALFKLIDSEERDYYILDTDGQVVHSKGQVADLTDAAAFPLAGVEDGVTAYIGQDNNIMIADEEDGLTVDLATVISRFNIIDNINAFEDNPDSNIIDAPMWVSFPVREGTEEFFCKTHLTAEARDFLYVTLFFATIMLLSFIVFIVLIVNIIASGRRRKKMLKLLFTDVITGGNNMPCFTYYANPIISKKKNRLRKYAVVSLKFVNYTNFCVCHSVAEGENMLRRVYGELFWSLDHKKKNIKLKKMKELVAHASTSSFALLLKYTDEEMIRRRVQDIISRLERLHPEHKLSFQAGITVVDESKVEEVDRRGRKIMDVDKDYSYAVVARDTLSSSDDSGIVILDNSLIDEQKWIDTIKERQQYALQNEEFLVYYQSKYDPRTNTLAGAEALIRWNYPEKGIIPPGRFIPIFEQSGFITQIDHYMLRHVARDQKRWFDMGMKCVPVSVNVSRAHFAEDDLAEQIRDIVDSEGTPHNLIEIELTESAFFDDKNAMIRTIGRLKEYGFAVSMDDFGAGYSSLNSLKDMPLDVLKLDAEFFRGEGVDGDRAQIVVSEAINLAKKLNMKTVAEGVEIREQVDFLAEQGCDMIQGYIYAKPEPGQTFETRMREQKSAASSSETSLIEG